MKRDMDLVREILLAVEASDEPPQGWIEIEIPDRTTEEVSYHLALLDEAGLLVSYDVSADDFEVKPVRLTWHGHEFIDSVRDPAVWRKTKEGAKSVGGAGLEIMWEIAKGYAKNVAKEKLGIEIS